MRAEFEWAETIDKILVDASPVWYEDGGTTEGRLMFIDMQDDSGLDAIFGAARMEQMREEFAHLSRHGILVYVYTEGEATLVAGSLLGKTDIAGRIFQNTPVETLQDILAHVREPRWEIVDAG